MTESIHNRQTTAPSAATDTPAPGTMEAHGVIAVNSRHAGVRRLRRQGHIPTIHGTKVWRSSFALMEYFEDFPLPNKAKVVDVGCGWGILSIYLAKHFQANVLAVDADEAVGPYLDLQCELNNVSSVNFQHNTLQKLNSTHFNDVHTVIGSDICFWDELMRPLHAMIQRALNAGAEQIIIADPGRDPFWALTELCDKNLNVEVLKQTTEEPYPTSKHLLIIEP